MSNQSPLRLWHRLEDCFHWIQVPCFRQDVWGFQQPRKINNNKRGSVKWEQCNLHLLRAHKYGILTKKSLFRTLWIHYDVHTPNSWQEWWHETQRLCISFASILKAVAHASCVHREPLWPANMLYIPCELELLIAIVDCQFCSNIFLCFIFLMDLFLVQLCTPNLLENRGFLPSNPATMQSRPHSTPSVLKLSNTINCTSLSYFHLTLSLWFLPMTDSY